MTTKEILETVATLPSTDCLEIQAGIAELLASRLSEGEISEIGSALAEAEAEYGRGEGLSSEEVRRRFGLQ